MTQTPSLVCLHCTHFSSIIENCCANNPIPNKKKTNSQTDKIAIAKTRDDRKLKKSVPSHVSDQYKLWFSVLVSSFTAVLIVIHYFTLGMHSTRMRILLWLWKRFELRRFVYVSRKKFAPIDHDYCFSYRLPGKLFFSFIPFDKMFKRLFFLNFLQCCYFFGFPMNNIRIV